MSLTATIAPAMARRIKLWPTDRLVPYARTARTHAEDQVAQIAASIGHFGFSNPLLVDSKARVIADQPPIWQSVRNAKSGPSRALNPRVAVRHACAVILCAGSSRGRFFPCGPSGGWCSQSL
jgi:hypothetical protein